MPSTHKIAVRVNGSLYEREIEARLTLADFLRHELNLTGTHIGCEHGVCGACTVLIDGRSARSCLTFAVQANNKSISTIEGLAKPDGTLSPLQEAFRECHGLQCGFCTPGILMTVTELLADDPNPSEEHVREVLTGNLCRCTGYTGIVKAVLKVAREMQEGARPDVR
jgi:aerobic-type carbon monoxide dehydrogenase small subunit (CoxS/CutS family)